ncbi:hypothetical protein WUBG_15791 [Wuchereria bancrofti]|uniref:TRC8-like N-terminal domain-containing protein n=1 Tax=Wuchereria bancrofti TaxID=6293 RepID=J9DUG2_WUCBA|nr:hypothetical protein WUBG_15791 [Wuchereria bancrofti]
MYFSIWRQLQTGIVRVQSRRAAYSSLSRLPRVSNEALQQRRDACAICLSDLLEDARITPCKHFFHSAFVSALLQSLYEILEPQLLALAANRSTSRGQHVRSVFLAIIVLVASLCASIAVSRFLPIDLWCLIIGSNCLLTAIHTLSTIIVYAIYRLETESMDTWGQADYVVFVCKTITCGVEVLLALNVVCFVFGGNYRPELLGCNHDVQHIRAYHDCLVYPTKRCNNDAMLVLYVCLIYWKMHA